MWIGEKAINELSEDMKALIDKTAIDTKERGFNICAKDNQILKEAERLGTKTRISTFASRRCYNGIYVGDFHTHPPQWTFPTYRIPYRYGLWYRQALPSMPDILYREPLKENEFLCIGSKEKKGYHQINDVVRCFDVKDAQDELQRHIIKKDGQEYLKKDLTKIFIDAMKSKSIKYTERIL